LDAIQSHRSNIGSVFGWPHLISEKTLAHFQGCIFNFHPTDLPRFRGPGGGFSWQILQRETDVCVSIHQMVPTFDAGSILLQEKAPIDPTRINPETYRSGLKKLYREIVFPKLAEIFLHADSVELDPQESASAQYFPKLDSTKNGLIDFSWDIDAIEVFVRAFGSPFQGANALYNETPYFIERSEIHRRISNVHPFCFGLIVDVADRHVSVLCNGGQLNFLGLRDSERVDVSTREFRVGNRMYNTPDALLQAKLFRPI
jgi:methionyl-tRNA formyltransferase